MRVEIARYPQLRRLCWQRPADAVIDDGRDALAVYERGWRHVDEEAMTPDERALLDALVRIHGNGVLNV